MPVIGNDDKGRVSTYRMLPDFGGFRERKDPRQRHHVSTRRRAPIDTIPSPATARASLQG